MKLAIIQNLGRREKLIIGGSLIGFAILYILINRAAKQAMLNKIYKAIDSGVNYYGDSDDAQSSNSFNSDFWKRVPPSSNLLGANQASEIAKYVNSFSVTQTIPAGALLPVLSVFYGSESVTTDNIYEEYRKKINTKAQASQVAWSYENQYKKRIFDDIKKFMRKSKFNELINYVQSLPDF